MDRLVVRPLPIGLAYVAAHIDEGRHQLQLLDLMFSENPIGDLNEAVKRHKSDIVGLSIRNLDNQSYLNPRWHLPKIAEMVSQIRAISGSTIVCGGPGFSILPAECLEYLGADLGIAGDAAESFAVLADRLDDGADYTDTPGI